jgi:hypothetical protein
MKLIFSVRDDIEIWPMFKGFYEIQGITEFLCVSYGPKLWGDNVITEYVSEIDKGRSLGYNDSLMQEIVKKKHLKVGEWVVTADLDEFITFGEIEKNSITRECELAKSRNCEYILGRFVDRVTTDGSLPEKLEDDIFVQFPICKDITERILGGCSDKVVASRFDVELSAGHHYPVKKNLNMHNRIASVNHFKFWKNSIKRIEKRKNEYQSKNIPWYKESERFLEYIKNPTYYA